MKSIRKKQIGLIAFVVISVACMAHISIKYIRAVDRLEEQTARVESMQKAYIRYLENKVEMLSAGCIAESEPKLSD